MSLSTLAHILGGIGLFLIGIELMQSGFQQSAGASLRRILYEYTDNRFKALVSGFVVSSAVQSATAVILTLIGFVNARVLKLKQAVDVVYGAFFGKVATVWLIAFIGFKLSLSSYGLPLIGLGSIFHLFFKNHRGLGTAFVGFGLMFLGLDTLKENIHGIESQLVLNGILPGFFSTLFFLLVGLVMTAIMQSSAAAMAVTFSMLAGGMIPVEIATALTIGQSLGTLTSAIMASRGASSVAQRLTAAYTILNLICSVLAFLILQTLMILNVIPVLVAWAHNDKTFFLTLFYSCYITLGIGLMLPFRSRFVAWLIQNFHNSQSLGTPQFIDRQKAYHPKLAIEALQSEVMRFGKISGEMIHTALTWKMVNGWVYGADLSYEERELDRLVEDIYWFASRTARKQATQDIIRAVQSFSLAVRYFEEAADMSKRITRELGKISEPFHDSQAFTSFNEWIQAVVRVSDKLGEVLFSGDTVELMHVEADFLTLEEERNALRKMFMDAGITREIETSQTIILIDLIDKCRLAMHNQIKGVRKVWELTGDLAQVATFNEANVSPV